MKLYIVLNTTSHNQPWVELVTEHKNIADMCCAKNQSKGLFSVVQVKELNRLPIDKINRSK